MQTSISLLVSALISCLVAGLVGHFPTRWVVSYLFGKFYAIPGAEEQAGSKEIFDAVQPFIKLLGVLERMVYAGSYLLGAPEFIAVILALKATPSLKEWSEKKILGRTQFNIWLTGNLMNVIQSVLIAEVVRLVISRYIP